ncbi:MAG: glycine oxidase ThiO [Solirubrobacteraceae bacterium]
MASHANPTVDVLVIGGGIVGLAVAWRAAGRGLSVTVLERDEIGHGASHVAAGMLAPVSELEFGEHGRRALELGLRSAQMWRSFAQELERASGVDVGLRTNGTLIVARDPDDARELEREMELRGTLGLRAVRLRASQAREREPALAPVVRMAVEAPDDHSVDPRQVVLALRRACELAGVEIRERCPVERVAIEGERVTGAVLTASPSTHAHLRARHVVVAAGCWSGLLDGLPAHARVPVRPVKGQIMVLRDPAGPGLLSGPVRYGRGYLVPRPDGRFVLGGTVEERGFDVEPTAGAVYELLRYAHELVPGVSELELIELNVGFRPGTPDNAPILGRGALDGLVWATGHYRNGILLTPLTADLVVGVLAGEGSGEERSGNAPHDSEALLATCDPARFASRAATASIEGMLR